MSLHPEPADPVPHHYGPSRVGHGEAQCVWCMGTNRENAVISPNHCDMRAARDPKYQQPNAETQAAMCEIREGRAEKFETVEEVFEDLRKADAAVSLEDHWRTLVMGGRTAGDEWAVRYLRDHFVLREPPGTTSSGFRCEHCGAPNGVATTHCAPPFEVRAHEFSGNHPADRREHGRP